MKTRSEWTEKHLLQLVGYKVVGLVVSPAQDYMEETYGLRLQKNGKQSIAWILSDEEGNGAGHLDIVPLDKEKLQD